MQFNSNTNIFYVFVESEGKRRLVTTEGLIFEITDQLQAPNLQESEFVNVASMFTRPDLSFLKSAQALRTINSAEISSLHESIAASNFFKAYKGGKNLGVINNQSKPVTLWIFNEVLTSTWKAQGDQELEQIVQKVISF